MDELIAAMSNEDLAELKTKYGDNAGVVTLIDGILETRGKEAEQVKVIEDFESSLDNFANGKKRNGEPNLPHPEHIYNIVFRWTTVDEVDTTAEPEEVEIVDGDGNKVKEMRQPTIQVHKWVVETNKGITVRTGGGSGTPATSKRAITVFKRDGTNLELKGHYQSASKACEALGLTIGGDSATRVLARDSFIVEPYDGTDFTS